MKHYTGEALSPPPPEGGKERREMTKWIAAKCDMCKQKIKGEFMATLTHNAESKRYRWSNK